MSIKAGWSEKLVLQMPKEVLESFAGRPQRCFYICCQCCHDVKYVIEGRFARVVDRGIDLLRV